MKVIFISIIYILSIRCEAQKKPDKKNSKLHLSTEIKSNQQPIDSVVSLTKLSKKEFSETNQYPSGHELILNKVRDNSIVALPLGFLGLNRAMPGKIDSIIPDCSGFVNLHGLSSGSYYLSDIVKNIDAPKFMDKSTFYNYYDEEVVNNEMNIHKSASLLTAELPEKNRIKLYLSYTEMAEPYQETLSLISFNYKGDLIDGLNLGYSIDLQFNYRQSDQKEFTNGNIGKYFLIDEEFIIFLNYTDTINLGESTECHFLRLEKWQVKENGKFTRYYEKDGHFKNNEEEGMVKNTMREGKWIEIKPNGIVNQKTYLEAEFKDGEPIGEQYYYDFINQKKGRLLYTEIYKDGRLRERTLK